MKRDVDYSLYLITDRSLMSAETLEQAVLRAIKGGCTMVQLREKELSSLDFYKFALSLKRITHEHGVPLIINDRVDIALAADADGVHVGQSDLPARTVRDMIGCDRLLGVSATNVAQAVKAQKDGADYIGVGAMYPTGTKSDAAIVSMEELRVIRRAVTIPIVVIGGINNTTAPDFAGTGIDGLSVVSAVLAREDIEQASRELRELFGKL